METWQRGPLGGTGQRVPRGEGCSCRLERCQRDEVAGADAAEQVVCLRFEFDQEAQRVEHIEQLGGVFGQPVVGLDIAQLRRRAAVAEGVQPGYSSTQPHGLVEQRRGGSKRNPITRCGQVRLKAPDISGVRGDRSYVSKWRCRTQLDAAPRLTCLVDGP